MAVKNALGNGDLGVYPKLWMVFVREIPTQMDDLEVPPILGNLHMMFNQQLRDLNMG